MSVNFLGSEVIGIQFHNKLNLTYILLRTVLIQFGVLINTIFKDVRLVVENKSF